MSLKYVPKGPVDSKSSLVQMMSMFAGISLGLRPTNERPRYNVTTSLIGWART